MPAFKAEEQNQLQIAEREEIGAIEKLTSHGINAGDVKKLQDAGIYTCDAKKMPASTSWVQTPPPTNPTFWQQVGKVVEHAVKQGAEDAIELLQKIKKGKEMEEKEKKRQEQLKNKPLAPAVLKKPALAPPEVKKPPTLAPAPAKVADDQAPANKAAPAGLLFPSSMGSTIDETGPSGSA